MDDYNEDYDPYNDEEEQEDKEYEPSKEVLIFLIDVQKEMLENPNLEDEPETFLELAVKQAAKVMKTRIISASTDELGIVFYGTANSNEDGCPNVWTFLPLEAANAERIRKLEHFSVKKLEKQMGGSLQGSSCGDPKVLENALWKCSNLLMGKKGHVYKRILLFSNSENPCQGGRQQDRDKVMKRAKALKDNDATLQFFPLIAMKRAFSMEPFWADLVRLLRDESLDESFDLCSPAQMKRFEESVSRRLFKKRAFRSLNWQLGEGLELAVQLFNLLSIAKPKTATVALEGHNFDPLTKKTAYICEDTGAILGPEAIVRKSFQAKTQDASRFPRKVLLTKQEIEQIKSVRPLGLKLVGFKPRSCLMDYHQLNAPKFVYPAEHKIKGSTVLFHALMSAMISKGQMAICSYVSRGDAMPALVAMLPQQEQVNEETMMQVEPPGMYMVTLPYADDLRSPETDPKQVGNVLHRANRDQVAAAEQLLDSACLPLDFSTTTHMSNPHLDKHFGGLQAIALGDAEPDELYDCTLPDEEIQQSTVEAITAFKLATVGELVDGAKGAGGRGTKRKAEDEGQPEYGTFDWKTLAANSGQLAKLKVDDLKIYLRHHGLKLSGNKAELAERVREDVLKRK